jgi:hypothetical protein
MSKGPTQKDPGDGCERRGRDPYNTTQSSAGMRRRVRSGPIELFRKARKPGDRPDLREQEERYPLEVTDRYPEEPSLEKGLDPYNTMTVRRPKPLK